MSYFALETDNNDINTNNKQMSEVSKINPRFSGHTHDSDTKKRISLSQSARYEAIRKLVRKGMSQPLTEERVKEICAKAIDEFCKRNAFMVKPNNNNNRPININL